MKAIVKSTLAEKTHQHTIELREALKKDIKCGGGQPDHESTLLKSIG